MKVCRVPVSTIKAPATLPWGGRIVSITKETDHKPYRVTFGDGSFSMMGHSRMVAITP
jgi:hypothetical protein